MKRYHNLSKLFSITLAIGFLPGVLRAAGPEAADKAAPRQIKFVLEDAPLELDVPEGARLPEGTFYAAIVRGYAPWLIGKYQNRRQVADQGTLHTITLLDDSGKENRLRTFLERSPNWFRSRIIENSTAADGDGPVQHAWLGEHVNSWIATSNLLLAGRRNARLASFQLAEPGARSPLQEYDFGAPKIDDAKQFARDLIALYDHAYIGTLAELLNKQKAELVSSRDKTAPELDQLNEQVAAAETDLTNVEPLADTAVNDLKVKRTLLRVELAGIKARVNTISDKLAALDKSGQPVQSRRRDQLVDLKVTADIDLASLAAQQDVLDDLIDGQRRLGELSASRGKRDQLQNRMEHIERNLPICDALLADLIPFQLVNDTIVIRPVKFVVKGDEAAGR